MRSKAFYTMLIVVMVFLTASSTIRNVPGSYPTIQDGISASIDGDTVLIQPDTYIENIDFNGKAIMVTSNFIFDSDSSTITQTIIDGDSLATVVSFHSGEDALSILAYLTITNGFGTGGYGDGGGITCNRSSPTILGCNIHSNTVVDGYGGGIHCLFGEPIIKSNVIHNNIALDVNVGYASGGGIWVRNGAPDVIDNIIHDNFASSRAGGVGGSDSLYIARNIIYGNTCSSYGGGIQTNASKSYIEYNLIYGNEASHGGGICFQAYGPASAFPASANNTIYGNRASLGGGIYCHSQTEGLIVNSIIYGNTDDNIYDAGVSNLSVTYSDVEGGYDGTGNIDDDPMFIDPLIHDFHLQAESPCIDAGDPASPIDPDSTRADMGAYYFDQPTGIDESHFVIPRFYLEPNYPNPFNASTTIRYSLPTASKVKIEIFNILGNKIETLVDNKLPAGYHQVIWDASKHSTGLYFCRIKADNFVESNKMLFLK